MASQNEADVPAQRESDSSIRALLDLHRSTNSTPSDSWSWLSRRTGFLGVTVVLCLCCIPMALWPLSRLDLALENEIFLGIYAASSFSPIVTLLLVGTELVIRILHRGRKGVQRSWFLGLDIACTLCCFGSGILVAVFLTESRYTTHGDLECPAHPEKPLCYAELYDQEGMLITLTIFYFALALLNVGNCTLATEGRGDDNGHPGGA